MFVTLYIVKYSWYHKNNPLELQYGTFVMLGGGNVNTPDDARAMFWKEAANHHPGIDSLTVDTIYSKNVTI